MRPARSGAGLLLLLAFYAVFSASFINYFCRTFGISRWLVAIHVPVVAGLFAVCLFLPALVLVRAVRRGRRYPAWIAATLAGIAASLLVVLYAANFASNIWFGSNVTHSLVELWVSDWWSGGDLLSLSPGMLVAFGGLIAAIITAHLLLARTIGDGFEVLFTRGRRTGLLAAAIVLSIGYSVFAQQLITRTPRSEFLSSDPALAIMRRRISVEDERTLAHLQALRDEDASCRASYAGTPPPNPPNVIVIIVDSLRADHLPLYGYSRATTPFLSELHESGRLRKVGFATSTCAESNCGIMSTLASKTLFRQAPGNLLLPTLLRDRGYESFFILSGSHDWKGLREMYGDEHTLYFDGRNSSRYSRSDDRVIQEGLERVPQAGRPSFFYFHLMSVHLIGPKLPEHRRYEPSAVKNDWNALFSGEYDPATVVNNYDNGVLQADATIRGIFATLEHKGYLQNSVVMILSDHGEGLGDRGRNHFGHVSSLYQEFIRIPMLIYDAAPRPYANLEFATQIDVAPTVVDRLGMPAPPCWEGTSMFAPPVPRATMHQTSLETPCYAVLEKEGARIYKYMRCFLRRSEALYELTSDPGETVDLRETADPALLARMRQRLDEARAKSAMR